MPTRRSEIQSGGHCDRASIFCQPFGFGRRKHRVQLIYNSMEMNKYALAYSIIGSILALILGYDTSVLKGATPFIQEDLKINDKQVELLGGIIHVFALVGCLSAGRVSDYIGRRGTILLTAVTFDAGSILMGLAPNFKVLLAGRCVVGLSFGFTLVVGPIYAAEISSATTRGSLTALPLVGFSFGIVAGYVANLYLAHLPLIYGWRAMLGLAAVPSALLAVVMLAMPESPRWFVMQGLIEEALEVLRQLCSTADEADAIWSTALPDGGWNGVWKEMFLHPVPPVRRVLVAAVGVHFFVNLTGIEAVFLYCSHIFTAAAPEITTHDMTIMSIGVGVTKTVFILVPILLIDRVGRRPLYLFSLGGVAASLAFLGLGLTVIERSPLHQSPPWATRLVITMMFTFMASFSIGMGPITWAYSSEVFPLQLRAQGASISVAVNRIMGATISMSFISLYKAITLGNVFFLFAGITLVAAIFFYFFCPETRGRPLEEIEVIFINGWDARRRLPHTSSVEMPVCFRKCCGP